MYQSIKVESHFRSTQFFDVRLLDSHQGCVSKLKQTDEENNYAA